MLPTTEDVLRALRQDLENASPINGGAAHEGRKVRCRACTGILSTTSDRLASHVQFHAAQYDHDPVTWWGTTYMFHAMTVVAPLARLHSGAGSAYAYDVKAFQQMQHRDASHNRYEPRVHEIALDFIFQHQGLVKDAGLPMRRVRARHPAWLISGDAYRFMLEVAAAHPSGPSVHRLDEMTALIQVFRAMKEQRREAA